MYLYVETWNAKPDWFALNEAERVAFIGKVQTLLQALSGDDLILDGCIVTDDETSQHGGYQYVAIWRASDKDQVRRIEEGTAGIGWHDYFDQTNLGGTEVGPQTVIEHMLQINEKRPSRI